MSRLLIKIKRGIVLIVAVVFFGFTGLPSVAYGFSGLTLTKGIVHPQVVELKGRLYYVGYYNGVINDFFDWNTYWAVRDFQRDTRLRVDGIVGPVTQRTLAARSIHWSRPAVPRRKASVHQSYVHQSIANVSYNDITLMSHVVYAEARGEPYIGQVAVADVILNRMHDPRFPHSIAGIIYQPAAFTSVQNGGIWNVRDQKAYQTAHKAVLDAVHGYDVVPSAHYYFNPATATSGWIWSKPILLKIGHHLFLK